MCYYTIKVGCRVSVFLLGSWKYYVCLVNDLYEETFAGA